MHVGVTVQSIDDDSTIGEFLLDLGDDRSNLSVTKGDVVLTHSYTTQAFDLFFDDGVRRAWVNVVRTDEIDLLAVLVGKFFKQPVDSGLSLLVGHSTGVEDVLGTLLTLILNGIEEEVILGFVDRQHGLTAG